jgi:hypothetical protein
MKTVTSIDGSGQVVNDVSMPTLKQLGYANSLLEWLDEKGELENAIQDLRPSLEENEDISDWFKRLSVGEMSEVIDSLKNSLEDAR